MSIRLALHPFRVQDARGRVVRFRVIRSPFDKSQRESDRALMKLMSSSNASGYKHIAEKRREFLKLNGYSDSEAKTVAFVESMCWGMMIVAATGGVLGSIFLLIWIGENVRPEPSPAMQILILSGAMSIVVVSCASLIHVANKSETMRGRTLVGRCAACGEPADNGRDHDHRQTLTCQACHASWRL